MSSGWWWLGWKAHCSLGGGPSRSRILDLDPTGGSGVTWSLPLHICSDPGLMPIFGKPGCPFLRGKARDLVTPEAFLDFVGSYIEQASLSSPVLTGEDLHATALAEEG